MASTPRRESDGIDVKTFEEVDDAAKVKDYIDILDAFDALAGMQALKARARERCHLRPGLAVLDDGCGTGLETLRLARAVAPSGRVVGTDTSRALLAEANRRAAGLGLPVEYREGDAEHLPLDDRQFDVARAERLFLYLADPARALAELVRVTKPGGLVYVIEPDFETVTINIDDRALVRKVLHFDCDHDTRQGWIGRELPGLFRAAGLADLQIDTSVVVFEPRAFSPYFQQIARSAHQQQVLTDAELAAWEGAIADLLARDALFATITYFMVMGTVPAARA